RLGAWAVHVALEEAARTDAAATLALAAEVSRGLEQDEREAVAAYLAQVPAAIRAALRRPADPSGRTAPPSLTVREPADLLSSLRPGLSRFRPDARPWPGSDWPLVEPLGADDAGESWVARSGRCEAVLHFCLDPLARTLLTDAADLFDRIRRSGPYPGIIRL